MLLRRKLDDKSLALIVRSQSLSVSKSVPALTGDAI